MIIGVPRETFPGERRVALVPSVVPKLVKRGYAVVVESGAGEAAGFPDAAFLAAGATVEGSRDALYARARILCSVRAFGADPEQASDACRRLSPEHVVVAMTEPLVASAANDAAAATGATIFALELIPRTTRAQSMDVLSSMATIAGYKAVILAADALPRLFPMLMTAAGTVKAAKVLILGAGVAGLQAIASSRRLGAIVEAYDVRPAVKEQVQSLGARFLEMPLETGAAEGQGGYAQAMDEAFYARQRELLGKAIPECQVVITTAAVPGKPAPRLIPAAVARAMAPGSVIVDLAAERGGNCELTRPGERVVENGVTILGPTNLPSEVPYHASEMYARNVTTFLEHLTRKEGGLDLDRDDEIARETRFARGGTIDNARVLQILGRSPRPVSGGVG